MAYVGSSSLIYDSALVESEEVLVLLAEVAHLMIFPKRRH
jgi:hypothetical protein